MGIFFGIAAQHSVDAFKKTVRSLISGVICIFLYSVLFDRRELINPRLGLFTENIDHLIFRERIKV